MKQTPDPVIPTGVRGPNQSHPWDWGQDGRGSLNASPPALYAALMGTAASLLSFNYCATRRGVS